MAGIKSTLIDATARRPRDARAPEVADPSPASPASPASTTTTASSPRPLRSGRRRHDHLPAAPSAEPDRTSSC